MILSQKKTSSTASSVKFTPRDLKIKTGIVKRTGKELIGYNKELEKQQARIEKLNADGADSHDISKQTEVLQETLSILPDCKRRLTASYNELLDIVKFFEDKPEAESEDFKAAKTVIEETVPLL